VLLPVRNSEKYRLFDIDRITGLSVLDVQVFRLHLIGRRGVFQRDSAMLARFNAKGSNLPESATTRWSEARSISF